MAFDDAFYGFGYLNRLGWALAWKFRQIGPAHCRWCEGALAMNLFGNYVCLECDGLPEDTTVELGDGTQIRMGDEEPLDDDDDGLAVPDWWEDQ